MWLCFENRRFGGPPTTTFSRLSLNDRDRVEVEQSSWGRRDSVGAGWCYDNWVCTFIEVRAQW